MKSTFGSSALLVSALLLSLLLLSAQPSLAETLLSNFQKQAVQQTSQQPASGGVVSVPTIGDEKPIGVTTEANEIAPKSKVGASDNPIAPKAAVEDPKAEGVHYVAAGM
jgi:hypothetical protein